MFYVSLNLFINYSTLGTILVSLLLTLNIFHTFFKCLYSWLWISHFTLLRYLVLSMKKLVIRITCFMGTLGLWHKYNSSNVFYSTRFTFGLLCHFGVSVVTLFCKRNNESNRSNNWWLYFSLKVDFCHDWFKSIHSLLLLQLSSFDFLSEIF